MVQNIINWLIIHSQYCLQAVWELFNLIIIWDILYNICHAIIHWIPLEATTISKHIAKYNQLLSVLIQLEQQQQINTDIQSCISMNGMNAIIV